MVSTLDRKRIVETRFLDTSHWRSISDITLTLKQGRSYPGVRDWIDEIKGRSAFRHFLNLLNRAVYKNAFKRHRKRLRVIPVLEKELDGRWHYHAAIEPPPQLDFAHFESLIRACWAKTHWGYQRIQVRPNANSGWINYMLKSRQKADFDTWADCIDWESFHNPIADA
jgi:hypothetical protein